MNESEPIRNCRPATLRDWLTAHSRVRLGRLDRFEAVRNIRDGLVKLLARGGTSVRFNTEYEFEILLPAYSPGIIIMALRGILFHATLLEVASRAIRPGDIVIDGGSNVGFFALLAATRLRSQGRVVAFEPAPETFSLLVQNIRLNGFGNIIRAEQMALTDREGSFDFAFNSEEPMLSSLVSGESARRYSRAGRVS
jgi:hypothetical protein